MTNIDDVIKLEPDTAILAEKVGTIIYEIASANMFYSKIYADLFAEIVTKYEWIRPVFNENFEITKNDMDRVKSCDIQDFLKRKNINMSMAKISNYLTNRGCVHGPHKFSGKVCKGFKGLRQIETGNIDE